MNITYQTNPNQNIYINYPNKPIQYIPSTLSSPKKIENFSSFNYGLRYYYSAEIKSNKKTKYENKPIYILNPNYIANQLPTNNNSNQNIIYQQRINDNINNSNLNMIPIFPSQNIIKNNINLMVTNNSNNPYFNQTTNRVIITQPTQYSTINNFNEQNIFNGFTQQNNFNRNTVPNNLYYNINQNNFIISQSEQKIQPFKLNDIQLENIEIQNFNNTMPNLTNNNELYTQMKNEFDSNDINERKTYQENHKVEELDNYLFIEPMRQTDNNVNIQNKVNNISIPKNENIFQNLIVNQKNNKLYKGLEKEKIIDIEIKVDNNINNKINNNNINPINVNENNQNPNNENIQNKNMSDIEKIKDINEENEVSIINNNIPIKKNENNVNNINNLDNNNQNLNNNNLEDNNTQNNNKEKSNINENNTMLNEENNKIDELNYNGDKSENININKNLNNNFNSQEVENIQINYEKINSKNENEIVENNQNETEFKSNSKNEIENNINNRINSQNIINELKETNNNIKNIKRNYSDDKIIKFDENKEIKNIQPEQLKFNNNIQINDNSNINKNLFNNDKVVNYNLNNIIINNSLVNNKTNLNKNINLNNKIKNVIINGRKKNAQKIVTEKKKSRRPVYKIPPSKKRSISQGKSLTFIHKYYDENFILEEENENEDNASGDDDEKPKNNNNSSKQVFQEVKIQKIQKNVDENLQKNDPV